MAPAPAPAGVPAASRVVEGSARNREWESAFAARWRGRRGPLETVRAKSVSGHPWTWLSDRGAGPASPKKEQTIDNNSKAGAAIFN